MINRRHALGLLAGMSMMPSRGFANVAPQRSEIREDLARHFADEGTAGTFVGYKTDDYLIIASDKNRSAEPRLPASTFKIPNSLIALETGVVQDPDKDVFKWDGVKRPIEENEVLAGALSNVELGDEIPTELYKAVVEVLVFVLRLSGRIR